MIRISPITRIDNQKHIAILDTSSISFMQKLQEKGVRIGNILCDYELILIPGWVLIEIEDAEGRAGFVQALIDKGYPIYSIAEETYTDLAGNEELNLYQIVLASTFLLAGLKSYIRRHVEKSDPTDMASYSEWIKQLYDEWPLGGKMLSTGREQKKNAGEVSITVLAEVISWYYPETNSLTVYSQDNDAFEFQRKAETILRDFFFSRSPIPVSYKSNDALICQLFRDGELSLESIDNYRKDQRKIMYSKERADHSVVLVTEVVDNASFINLIQDASVRIIF